MILTLPIKNTIDAHPDADNSSPEATVLEVASATYVYSPSASLSTSWTRSPTEPHTDASTGEGHIWFLGHIWKIVLKVPINIMFVVKSLRLCLRRGQSWRG